MSQTHNGPDWRLDRRVGDGDWSAQDLYQLIEFRYILEPQVASFAAERASASEIMAIDRAVAALLGAAAPGAFPAPAVVESYVRAIGDVHQAIANASGNRAASALVRRGLGAAPAEVLWRLHEGHSAADRGETYGWVAEAIRARRPEEAHDVMEAHLGRVLGRARRLMEVPPC